MELLIHISIDFVDNAFIRTLFTLPANSAFAETAVLLFILKVITASKSWKPVPVKCRMRSTARVRFLCKQHSLLPPHGYRTCHFAEAPEAPCRLTQLANGSCSLMRPCANCAIPLLGSSCQRNDTAGNSAKSKSKSLLARGPEIGDQTSTIRCQLWGFKLALLPHHGFLTLWSQNYSGIPCGLRGYTKRRGPQ